MRPNPFLTVWISPRETVRRIIAENPELHVILLACLTGVVETLDRASGRNAGDKLPMASLIVIVCAGGPLGGLVSLWISSHLIRWTGGWIGGVATREHVKTAIAWASTPVVFALPLWIAKLLLFGSEMFTEETPRLDAHPILLIPLIAMALIEVVLSIWSLVLLCNTLAEVQSFPSAWRGLANIILSGIVIILIIIPLIVIAFFAMHVAMA